MTVADAFQVIADLKIEYEMYKGHIAKPNHASLESAHNAMKEIRKRIKILKESIYNQELDDSYDQNGERNE